MHPFWSHLFVFVLSLVGTARCAAQTVHYPQEVHLANVRQLTSGGDNAEAYWSFGGDRLIFQSNNPAWSVSCDQIYILQLDSAGKASGTFPPTQVSTGLGRTTCSYFLPGDTTFVYASTHLGNPECPEVPARGPSGEYVWPIYADYDVFVSSVRGGEPVRLTNTPGYDAEATVSPRGDRMVFTSMRSGDLELYTCALDGSDVRQITNTLGYDGGAFFSPDGKWIVWRASRPSTDAEREKYLRLLGQGLVEPTDMELFVARADGRKARQITTLGGANWAPFFTPDGKRILFATNHHTGGFPFNLFLIGKNGQGLEQVTFDSAFDSFPMFSPDGKRLVFASNRNNGRTRSTNLFIADWID